MELILLDSNFKELHIVDAFSSLIWTDRYWLAGDFELVTIPEPNILSKLLLTSYLYLKESDHLMILEDFNLHSDIVDGYSMILKGRSLESILERRIIWDQTSLSGNLQDAIAGLINDAIILPTDTNREIPNFTFQASVDTAITSLTIDTQVVGNTLYEIISAICQSQSIGFKVVLTAAGEFEFSLYAGKDRSEAQSTNSWVIFSPEYDNLRNADYIETGRYERTVCLVAGEKGVGNLRRYVTAEAPGGGPSIACGGSRLQPRAEAPDSVRRRQIAHPGGALSRRKKARRP